MEAAVAGYAQGVLKTSVGKLGSFLLNEALLTATVREDIISIRDELQSMDAVLRDLICAKQLNQLNKVWMLHVLQVACDAELCIDEFAKILGGHIGHGIAGAVRRFARGISTIRTRHSIAKTIQGINVRAKGLSERRARYNTTIQANMPDAIELTRRAHVLSQHQMQNWHLIAEDDLVGIFTETWPEVQKKAGEPRKLAVISGPAGSGKTALAKMVYRRRNDPNSRIYQASAWVTLREKLDEEYWVLILKDILKQIKDDEETENYTDKPEIRDLIEKDLLDLVQKHLLDKRFLLVFDSVRTSEDLRKLKGAFLEGALLEGSSEGTIVATTRKEKLGSDSYNIYTLERGKLTDRAKHDLCAKLLFNLTSATQTQYQWLINIGDLCWVIWNSFKRFGDLLREYWKLLFSQDWFRKVWKMVVFVLIMYQFVHIVMSMVSFYIHNWAFTMLVLVLRYVYVQDVKKRFTELHEGFTGRFLSRAPEKNSGEGKESEGKVCQRGDDEVLNTQNRRVTESKQNSKEIHLQSPRPTSMMKLWSKVQPYSTFIINLGSTSSKHPLEFVLVLSISSLVIWNLFQGQIWWALFKATHIVVWLVYQFIPSQLNAVVPKSKVDKLKGDINKVASAFNFVIFLGNIERLCIFPLSLYFFLCKIIRRVVSFLHTYIVEQVERIVYMYLTRVKGIPLNRVRYYLKLTSSEILKESLVPLEIKFICGALTSQRMESNKVDKFFKKLDELAKNKKNEERLQRVTTTCYQLMSQSLKQCAQDLHKDLPECYAVKRKRITRRWIARGLASPKLGQSSEEVAECYFDELQVRGFIEPESVYPTGKTKTCRINSVFKAIGLTILNSTEESVETNSTQTNTALTSQDNQQRDAPLSDTPPNQTQLNSDETSQDNLQGDDVTEDSGEKKETLAYELFDMSRSTALEPLRKEPELKDSLLVLDLEGCRNLDTINLSFLCSFVKLRFLSFKNTNIKKVPSNIGKLEKLETLDIRQTQIEKVPENILKLKKLKRLFAGYFYKPESATNGPNKDSVRSIELPVGVEEMSNLETLAHVNATRASKLLISVQELTRLKKLGLVIGDDKLNPRPLCISLMMLSDSLRSLSICDERQPAHHGRVHSLDFLEYLCFPPLNLNSLTLSGYLERLPQWVSHLKLLCKLTLAKTRLKSNAVRLIGKIPTLLCLKLYRDSYDEYCLDLETNEFAVLKVLIVQCVDIQMICFEKGTATKLEVFRWVFSKAHTGEVSGINNLPMLKEVSLIGKIGRALEKNVRDEVKNHSNWKNTTLAFEKIEKKKPKSRA